MHKNNFQLFYFQKKKSPAEIMAIYEEMKEVLRRRDFGDLKGKKADTKTVIQKIKREYLNKTEIDKISKELVNIQSRIRSQLKKHPRVVKNYPEYITEHLKLTCRFVMDKYPLT